MKTLCTSIALLALTLFFVSACKSNHTIKEIEVKKGSLDLGYMYWANDFTPFGFGSRYSLIVLGTVTELKTPSTPSEDALYTSVEGRIIIQEVIYDSKSHNRDMNTIRHLETDCFDGTSLKEGNQVLVFCVSYEGDYAITGRQSIIKIPKNDKRYITSIKKYINASYNPTVIEEDLDLWSKVAVGEALQNYIKEYRTYKND